MQYHSIGCITTLRNALPDISLCDRVVRGSIHQGMVVDIGGVGVATIHRHLLRLNHWALLQYPQDYREAQ